MSEARLPATPSSSDRYRLLGARLVDGTGADPVLDAEVVVENGRLGYVGPRRSAEDPTVDQSLRRIDLAGLTVLPGFIDTHVHLAFDLEAKPATVLGEFRSERVLGAATTIRETLMAGITTARDLAGLDAGYRRAIAAGTIVGPRLHLAVTALAPTGGHTDVHLPNGAVVGMGVDDSGVDSLVDSDDEVRRAVRLLVRAEADVIKVCTTGGVSSPSDTPHDLGVPERHVRMIVEETARRQHQPVAAHAQGAPGILEALRGGVTSIEHGYEIDQEGIDLMLERGAFLVPTLSAALRVPRPQDVPDYLYQKKVRWSGIAREHLAHAFACDVTVAMGTDSAVCPHAVNLTELGHLVDLGMSPMDAIVAGTRNAARLLRLDEHLGTVVPGKLADLVVTAVDPLTDIHALADPAAVGGVVQGGRVVKDLYAWFTTDDRREIAHAAMAAG